MNWKQIGVFSLIFLLCGLSLSQTGTKKKRPLQYEYGRVVINNYSERSNLAPVVFEHWIHRSMFTCRVCHVDVGLGMKANSTGIHAGDIERGFYCGACHNGRTVVNGKKVFAGCSRTPSYEDQRRCDRCHSLGKKVQSDFDFFTFSAPLPKERFGNGIDWEKSEELGLPGRLHHPEASARGAERLRPESQGGRHAGHYLLAQEAHRLEWLRTMPSGHLHGREERQFEVQHG
jgi:c(7)-type cytochrome triheme protein